MNSFQKAIDEVLRSIGLMIDSAMGKTTKIYDGMVQKIDTTTIPNPDHDDDPETDDENIYLYDYTIRVNGNSYQIKPYRIADKDITVGMTVKVIVPQGNMNLAFFI